MSRKTDGSWNVSTDGFDHATSTASFFGSALPPGRSMRNTLKRQRSPGAGGVLTRAADGSARRPFHGRNAVAVHPVARPALSFWHARLRPARFSRTTLQRGVDHPQIADHVRRADIELVVGVARAVGVEEDFHDLLLPEVRVAARHRMPGRGVVDVVTQVEALVVPERAEARLVRRRSPRDRRARRPCLVVRRQKCRRGCAGPRDLIARRAGGGRQNQCESRRRHAFSPKTRSAFSW